MPDDFMLEALAVVLKDLKQVQTAFADLITMLYKNGTITLDQSRELAKTIFGDRIKLREDADNDI